MKAVVAAAILAAALAAPAAAQETPSWRPWRPLLAVGGGVAGSDALGARTIETRAVATGTTTPPPFTLFRTDSTLDAGAFAAATIAVPVTDALALEVLGTAGRRTLRTAITADAESAPAAEASERVSEYLAGGRVSYLLPVGRWRRGRPFVALGGAYLRQLHEDNVLVETGQAWTVSGGLHAWLRRGPRRPFGATLEGGWQWRTGGVAFADGARSAPSLSLRLFVGI